MCWGIHFFERDILACEYHISAEYTYYKNRYEIYFQYYREIFRVLAKIPDVERDNRDKCKYYQKYEEIYAKKYDIHIYKNKESKISEKYHHSPF